MSDKQQFIALKKRIMRVFLGLPSEYQQELIRELILKANFKMELKADLLDSGTIKIIKP